MSQPDNAAIHPIFREAHPIIILPQDCQKQIVFFKEELELKEKELLKKNEKIIKLKTKIKKLKLLASNQEKISKELNEYRINLQSTAVETALKSTNLSQNVIVYKNHDEKHHETLIQQIEEITRTFQEKEIFYLKQKEDLENSLKAQLIIQEENYKIKEKELVKSLESLQESLKNFSEKIIFMEIHIKELKHKKKNVKKQLKETLRRYEHIENECKEIYEQKISKLLREREIQEGEMKSILNRNSELEEILNEKSEFLREKIRENEIFIHDIKNYKNEKEIWKKKFEETCSKLKEVKGESIKKMELYYANFLELVKKCMKKCQERENTCQEKVFREVYQMPMQACHCNFSQNIPIIQKEPIIYSKSNKNTKNNCISMFEEMLANMKKDLNILTRENYSEKEEYFLNGTNNCEICFLLTDELAKTNEFERFFQNFSEKMLMSRKLIDLNVSAVLFGKNEEGSFLIDFKKLEKFSFIKSQKKKIIDLYSLEEISWTRQSKKLLVAFISKETEIERFLMINKHFIHKTNTKCILISPSSNLLQKLDVEALESTWEEIEDLPNIISNILF